VHAGASQPTMGQAICFDSVLLPAATFVATAIER
jgi:hypothetical protein